MARMMSLQEIRELPPDQALPIIASFVAASRAAASDAMALRDDTMRLLVAKGWKHRQIAEAAGVSVPTVRAVLR